MPISALSRRARGAALALVAGTVALGLAACGGGGGSGDADPAKAVPASAPIYLQAVLRPDGRLKDDTEAALRKILGTGDPSAKVQQLLRSQDQPLSYQDDVEPWLGRRAALFFTSFADNPDGAFILTTTDPGKARDALAKDAGAKSAKRSYHGVDYRMDGDTAEGVVGDYAVIGSQRGFHTVVDTLKNDKAQSIDEAPAYKRAMSALGGTGDAIGTMYLSTRGLLDTILRSGNLPPQVLLVLRQGIAAEGGTSATAAKLVPSGDAVTLDTASTGTTSAASASGGDSAAALAALPGDSWLGIGISSVGDRLRAGVKQATQGLGASSGLVMKQVQDQLGIDLDKDLFSWMGDGGLFVRGTSLNTFGGALVVHTSDPTATKRAIAKIVRLVRAQSPGTTVHAIHGVKGVDSDVMLQGGGMPVGVHLALAGDRFILAVGRPGVAGGAAPASTLADNPSFKGAESALGDTKPALFVDAAPIAKLLRGTATGQSADARQVLTYLSRFGALAAGGSRDGGTAHGEVVLTLR